MLSPTPISTLLVLFLQEVNSTEVSNATPSFSPQLQNLFLSENLPGVIKIFRGSHFKRYCLSLPISLLVAQVSG